MTSRITPGVAPRLYFVVLDSTGEPVTDLAVADITSIAYRLITGGVAGATSSTLSLTAAVVTDAHSTGSTGPVRAADGWYFCDAPVGAADANADAVELVVVLDDGTHVVYPSVHEIDVATRTRSTFDHTSDEVTTDAASRTASQADVSGLATQSSVDTIDTVADAILVHTTELQANQGNWVTATGFSTHSAADVVTALGTGSTLTACLTATGFAVPGDAMALTPSERSTFAGVLDLAIVNQGDGANLIGALADAIAADWVAGDASPLAIIAALKADATYTTLIADAAAGKTAAELVRDRLTAARAEKLDRDLAHAGDANTYKADVSSIETKAQADARQSALTTAIGGLDTKIGTPAASVSADIAAVKTDTGNLVTRITATLFSGMTSLANWLSALAGSATDSATLAEINNTTAGASFTNVTDSLQAIRDRGDSGGFAGVGGGSSSSAEEIAEELANLDVNPLATSNRSAATSPIEVFYGTTWKIDLMNLPAIASWDRVVWTMKRRNEINEPSAMLQIQLTNGGDATDGIVRLLGVKSSAETQALGSIEVIDDDPGHLRIRVSSAATIQFNQNDPDEFVHDAKVYGTGETLATEADALLYAPSPIQILAPVTHE